VGSLEARGLLFSQTLVNPVRARAQLCYRHDQPLVPPSSLQPHTPLTWVTPNKAGLPTVQNNFKSVLGAPLSTLGMQHCDAPNA